jgi:hypothetical protein
MCDYSLHGVKNRLAVEGEQLRVYKFYTGSKGLAAVEELEKLQQPTPLAEGAGWWERIKAFFSDSSPVVSNELRRCVTAVCIPPGAQLELQGIPPHLQREFGVGAREYVTFVQLNAEAFRYRDAFRFDNGREVLIQKLNEDLRVEVLQLVLAEDLEENAAAPQVEPHRHSAAARDWAVVR